MNGNQKAAIGCVVSGSIGVVVGYFAAKAVLEPKHREDIQQVTDEARVYYQNLYSRQDIVLEAETPTEEEHELDMNEVRGLVEAQPERKIQEAVEAQKTYEGEEETPQTESVFERAVPPSADVIDALLADRDTDKPYIITKQEFLDNEPEHEQIAFTYFEGDSVLIKDDDEFAPIEDIDFVVGEDNLYHFGYGSEDELVVYVRNENVSPPYDLHVTKSPGYYVHEVINGGEEEDETPHLAHTQRKFRLNRE